MTISATLQDEWTSNSTRLADQLDTGLAAAILPYWPVWAAAQFASTDETKDRLQFIHVWRDKDAYQIESTDGHRAFRYRVPLWQTDLTPTLWRIPDSGVLLPAKPLKKAVSKTKLLTVSNDLRATFHGGSKGSLDELSSVNCAGTFSVHTAEDWKPERSGDYPQLNQLWPDAFSNNAEKPFAFNASYLKQWFSVVEKLSHNGVTKVRCNSANSPFVMSSSYVPQAGQHFDQPEIELLLMPVIIRD